MTKDRLARLGWDAGWEAELKSLDDPELLPGRVGVEHRGAYVLLDGEGDRWAVPTGRLRLAAREGGADLPAVGDWVAFRQPAQSDRAVVQAVLPRRTKFSRKTAWHETKEQVLATNVDVVFLTQALPDDLNLRRLERYLATGWESGAQPVVLLTKADLAPDVDASVAEVEAITFGVPVHAVSAPTGEGLDAIRSYLEGNRTAVLLGSSGVGKSTIVNALLGDGEIETQELRSDGRGRHTTTRRELHMLPGGGIVLDTPGIRELQLWDTEQGLEEAFEDVEELAAECRFGDCAHEQEPGCAVREALATGALPAERWESYRKLQRELEALEARQNALLRSERRRQWKIRNKAMRKQ
ncbi:MAG TPA: ribosome small subunit-dependent GTPase A [Gaiellaceae bacterium]|nr:ribosome small subunit-dependent GTPase A [Gaiellaceae bacterium]